MRFFYRIVCRPPKDGKWGTHNASTGSWDGIVGELGHREIDIAAAPYVITKERTAVFDFSEPILRSEYVGHDH